MIRIKPSAGFTLVEMIMVIVITGIIAGMVAVFLKSPVEGYFSTVRRAALTEEADSALRFIARDLQSALPNSIACADAGTLQFLTVRSGGRYREAPSTAGTEIPLVFGAPTGSFDMIGNGTATTTDARGNSAWGSSSRVVVGNLSLGVDGCHSYSLAGAPVFDNNATAPSLSASASRVTFNDGSSLSTFPVACNLASAIVQSNSSQEVNNREVNNREFGRFYVVDSSPVSYACNSTAGLTRTSGGGTPALLVAPSHVVPAGCHFACDNTKGRVQMITLNLSLQDKANEQVNLLRRVTIVNRP